jgi:hypothetical protein
MSFPSITISPAAAALVLAVAALMVVALLGCAVGDWRSRRAARRRLKGES